MLYYTAVIAVALCVYVCIYVCGCVCLSVRVLLFGRMCVLFSFIIAERPCIVVATPPSIVIYIYRIDYLIFFFLFS